MNTPITSPPRALYNQSPTKPTMHRSKPTNTPKPQTPYAGRTNPQHHVHHAPKKFPLALSPNASLKHQSTTPSLYPNPCPNPHTHIHHLHPAPPNAPTNHILETAHRAERNPGRAKAYHGPLYVHTAPVHSIDVCCVIRAPVTRNDFENDVPSIAPKLFPSSPPTAPRPQINKIPHSTRTPAPLAPPRLHPSTAPTPAKQGKSRIPRAHRESLDCRPPFSSFTPASTSTLTPSPTPPPPPSPTSNALPSPLPLQLPPTQPTSIPDPTLPPLARLLPAILLRPPPRGSKPERGRCIHEHGDLHVSPFRAAGYRNGGRWRRGIRAGIAFADLGGCDCDRLG
ncbi:hypothetical protein K458DRAFT_397933 [Lentithecium fluviatile CBS 122367]|uniref:Uncharacterized protein n=1 Tax=Lentithecium fluviatile CBS 122367 TaxID=1168545 RepID=A0A6G1JMS1_9PLEO|nr:hypothetical protein K458DRAFT_397933 [Lentithecium fluviatile CBS 122367]